MNLRKALSVIFISALIANAALLGACKDDNAGEAEPAQSESAPPPSEAMPADHGHEHGSDEGDEGMEEDTAEGEEADM